MDPLIKGICKMDRSQVTAITNQNYNNTKGNLRKISDMVRGPTKILLLQ